MLTENEVARSIKEMGVSDFVDYLDRWRGSDETADLSVDKAVLMDAMPGKVCGGYYECVELIADEVSSVATTVGAVWNRTSTQDFQAISAGYSADENISIARFHC